MLDEQSEFKSLSEIRQNIDGIDKEIISLISRRALCVKAAAKFKTSEDSVRAPERVKEVLAQRREWAKGEGLDENFIEGIFKNFISYFVNMELAKWTIDAKQE